MKLVSVDLDRHPEHADELRRHALRVVHDGKTVQLPAKVWGLIREGIEPSRGLGDTIATITRAMGIRACGGCDKRREKLNHWVPYRPAKQTQYGQGSAVTRDAGPLSE